MSPRRTFEFGTFEGIVGCVAAGMGLSLMPRVLVEQRGLQDSVRLHALPARFATATTLMVWPKAVEHHAARDAFFAVMEQRSTAPQARAAVKGSSRTRAA